MRICKLRHGKSVKHAHPLVREFWRLMHQHRASALDVAERAGVDDHTMSRWRYRYSPKLTSFEAALNVLGYRLAIVPEDCVNPNTIARYERKIYDRHPRVPHGSQSPATSEVAYDAASHEGA